MTITPGMCFSFIVEQTLAIHDFSSDTLKVALYDTSAELSPSTTTAYSATNECSGSGYTAGGEALAVSSGYPSQDSDGNNDYRFDDVVWGPAATITTTFGALIYNSSKANRAITILKFPLGRVISSDTFTLSFPLTLPAPLRFGGR
jgi:hypothetical protein